MKVTTNGAGRSNPIKVIPSASRLVRSLRDLGYDFPQAVADLVVPAAADVDALRAALENLANELMVDIDIDTSI